MELENKKNWKKASTAGLIFSILCLIFAISHARMTPDEISFNKIIRLSSNFVAVNLFLYLFFNPLDFKVYAILFYVYGNANLLDNGNILGSLCISLSFLFLKSIDYFRKNRILKFCILYSISLACILVQLVQTGFTSFLFSVMHIFGTTLVVYFSWLLLSPKLEKSNRIQSEKILSSKEFSQRDVDFLENVLNGEKYSKMALINDISESTVKARMIELYHALGVNSKTEFITVYNGYKFSLDENSTKTEGQL